MKRLYSRDAGEGFHSLSELLHTEDLFPHDVILHLAWGTVPLSAESREGTQLSEDLEILKHLLRKIEFCAHREKVHFIFLSSGSVYGNADRAPSRETDRPAPIGSYAREKLAAEEVIRSFAERTSVPCTILRVSNVYGFLTPAFLQQGIIPLLLQSAMTSQPIRLWGDGTAAKDYLHITDFISALKAVLARGITGTYNISSGQTYSVLNLVDMVENLLETKLEIEYMPSFAWDVRRNSIDNAAFRTVSNWIPEITLDQGLTAMSSSLLNAARNVA